MKDIVTPTIEGEKRKYPVLAGIEAEIDLENNKVIQPRIYLIEGKDKKKALYFYYRKGEKDGRKGGYGMFLYDWAIKELRNNPTDKYHLADLKNALQNLADSIPDE